MQKNDYIKQAYKAFLPPKDIEIDEWAEQNIILPELTCPEPGPMRISRTPYTRGPLKAFKDPYVEVIVLVWGRQTAKSQGVLYVCLAYAVACDPGPSLMLLPSETLSKYTMSARILPMFEKCKAVMDKRTSNKYDYTTLEIKFIDSIFSAAGGGSATQTMSRPVRYLFRDEIDELKAGVGTDATDPMKSSEETTSNFSNRKIVDTSTPTKVTGNVWKRLGECQYVFELWVPCLHCGRYFVILCGEKDGEFWGNIDIHGQDDPEAAATLADLVCFSCGGHMKNHQKPLMLERGEWRARITPDVLKQIMENVVPKIEETVPLNDVLMNPATKKVGFHLPKWYSPFAHGTYGDCAREWMNAQGDYLKMAEWSKFWAARPYIEQAENAQIRETSKRVVEIPAGVVPDETIALTLGFDPGQRGVWHIVWAWLPQNRMHLVDYGHTSLIGRSLEEQIEFYRRFVFDTRYPSASGQYAYPIWRAGMDTGGGKEKNEPMTMTVKAYAIIKGVALKQAKMEANPKLRRLADQRLLATKGVITGDRTMRESKLEKDPNGKPIPGGLILWDMNVNILKSAFAYAFNLEPGKQGSVTLHSGNIADFIAHVTSEELVQNKKGEWEWLKKPRTENHLLDCTTNAWAVGNAECNAGGTAGVSGLERPQRYELKIEDRPEPAKTPQAEDPKQEVPADQRPVKRQPQQIRRTGWFRR